jgi:hypothetical protein
MMWEYSVDWTQRLRKVSRLPLPRDAVLGLLVVGEELGVLLAVVLSVVLLGDHVAVLVVAAASVVALLEAGAGGAVASVVLEVVAALEVHDVGVGGLVGVLAALVLEGGDLGVDDLVAAGGLVHVVGGVPGGVADLEDLAVAHVVVAVAGSLVAGGGHVLAARHGGLVRPLAAASAVGELLERLLGAPVLLHGSELALAAIVLEGAGVLALDVLDAELVGVVALDGLAGGNDVHVGLDVVLLNESRGEANLDGLHAVDGLEGDGLLEGVVRVVLAEDGGVVGNGEADLALEAVVLGERLIKGNLDVSDTSLIGVVVEVKGGVGHLPAGGGKGAALDLLVVKVVVVTTEVASVVGVNPGLHLVTDEESVDDGLGLVVVVVLDVELEDVLATLVGDLGDELLRGLVGAISLVLELSTLVAVELGLLTSGTLDVLGDGSLDLVGERASLVVVGSDGGKPASILGVGALDGVIPLLEVAFAGVSLVGGDLASGNTAVHAALGASGHGLGVVLESTAELGTGGLDVVRASSVLGDAAVPLHMVEVE